MLPALVSSVISDGEHSGDTIIIYEECHEPQTINREYKNANSDDFSVGVAPFVHLLHGFQQRKQFANFQEGSCDR